VVRVFSGRGKYITGYHAASNDYRGGVWVDAIEADGDGKDEIVTGTWSNGRPGVFIVDVDHNFTSITLQRSFDAYHPFFSGGLRLTGVE